MNKKFVSFVLAMVLSVGLGVSSLFAGQSYNEYADDFVNGLMAGGSTTITISESGAAGLDGNLSQVFQYVFGSVTAIQGAGRQFTLMDSTKGYSFSIDAAGGKTWSVVSGTLSSSEIAKMVNMTDEERLAFLKEKGFSDNFFEVAKMDESGHLLDADGKQLDSSAKPEKLNSAKAMSELLGKLVEEGAKGVNHGVTLSQGSGVTGPSLTVSEDGKTMATYQTDPRFLNADGSTRANKKALTAVQTYLYDEKGWMKNVISKTFEMKDSKEGKATLEQTMSVTDITYDAHGVRKDTTYSVSADKLQSILDGAKNGGNLLDSVQTAIHGSDVVGIGGKIEENSKIFIMTVTNYSANNSKISSFNNKTSETTMYANNQISYVINAQGDITSAYRFSDNNVFRGSWTKTGVNENGVDVGTITLADEDGRALFEGTGTLSEFNDSAKLASLRAEYENGLRTGKFDGAEFVSSNGAYVPKSGTGTKINKVYIYADQILNTSNSAIMSNGFIDMNKVAAYVSSHNNIDGILNATGRSLTSFGYNTNDIKTMLGWATNPGTAIAQTSITHGSWSAKDKSNTTIDTSGASAIATNSASLGSHKWHSIQLDGDSRMNGISFSNTICIGGAAAYTKEHRVITEYTGTMETDPAVKGTYQGTVNINGKTYAVVSASEVNIMDGNGFQAAEGEKILVELDEETAAKIASLEKGDEVMFMGDVRKPAAKDSNGNPIFTMAVNTSYSGGVATGSDISRMRDAIQNEKLDWVKKNTAINSALIGDQNAGGDWKSGWKILANGGKKDPKEHIPANDLPVLF